MTTNHDIPFRVGLGYDIHRLQNGGNLVLGGIPVSSDRSPISHSDGDVVIHAIVDAILGALALGDIGDWFPNSDPQWKNAPSTLFLDAACSHAQKAHFRLVNVDLTILAERPLLKSFKPRIAQHLSQLLHAPVNIKAGTNEKCDAVGSGQAIACHAVVLLARK